MKNLLAKTGRAAIVGTVAAGANILTVDTLVAVAATTVISTLKSGDFNEGMKSGGKALMVLMGIHAASAITMDIVEQIVLADEQED